MESGESPAPKSTMTKNKRKRNQNDGAPRKVMVHKKVVSPYFKKPKKEPQNVVVVAQPRLVSPYFENPKNKKVAQTDEGLVVSPYFKKPKNEDGAMVSPYFEKPKKEAQNDGDSVVSPYFNKAKDMNKKKKRKKKVSESEFGAESLGQMESSVESQKKKKKVERRGGLVLSSGEKRDEAYRRKTAEEESWKPPESEIRLLQQEHLDDPWKVLVICMLLNRTTGCQARKIISELFSLCPNAKAATEVAPEEIEKIIHSLGIQQKRALMIQRFSRDYLGETWTHVTQLHGIGKYAADAYAIFCTGKWDQVKPTTIFPSNPLTLIQ